MDVVLYSTGCPRCMVLKKKLEENGIKYTENNSVDEMLELGITHVPMLMIDDELLSYAQAFQRLSK